MFRQLLGSVVQLTSLPRIARVRREPLAAQAAVLRYLLGRARLTEWGRRYGYAPSLSAEAFAGRVPVRTYEQLYPELEQVLRGRPNVLWPGPAPRWQARSSGTTNARSKYLPLTAEALHHNHYRAGRDMLALALHHYPGIGIMQGQTLSLGGSYGPSPFGAAQAGDVSALIMRGLPGWAEQLRTPPLALALLDEWEDKLERIARHVLRQDVRVLAGVPTWMVVLLRRVLALTGARELQQVWPRLGLFLHGAVAFGPYQALFAELAPSLRYLEIYNASEGYFALQDEPGSADLLLLLDHGIYYEFLPLDQLEQPHPRPLPLEAVELGASYALVISTNAGLWRYLVGDTVRFTSLRPYRVRITGRTKHFLNAFGEEVVVENAEAAVAAAARATGVQVRDFTAAPIYFAPGVATSRGSHEWAVELSSPPLAHPEPELFAQVLDAELRRLNSDYDAKRHRDLALAPPRLHLLPAGTFEAWLRRHGGVGGQRKVPRLLNSRQVLEEVLALRSEVAP